MSEIEDRRRKLLEAEYGHLYDFVSEVFRWIMTSQLVLNGGALVALLSVENLRPLVLQESGYIFVGGCVAALFSGMFMAAAMAISGLRIERALWNGDDLIGDRDQFVSGDKNKTAGLIAAFFLAFSLVCFVLGCLSVARISTADGPSRDTRQIERKAA